MNWPSILAAVRRAQAAYLEDSIAAVAAFAEIGDVVLGRYENSNHQAYALRASDGGIHLAISGTRFGQSVGDVLADAYLLPSDLGGGASVSSGAYSGMEALWGWAKPIAPEGSVWNVSGHSLGGQRALLTGLFLPPSQIGSIAAFEAPRTGNSALWARLIPSLNNSALVCNGEDFFFEWGEGWLHPPLPHIHLLTSGFEIIESGKWPAARSVADHAVDLIEARIAAIASK